MENKQEINKINRSKLLQLQCVDGPKSILFQVFGNKGWCECYVIVHACGLN